MVVQWRSGLTISATALILAFLAPGCGAGTAPHGQSDAAQPRVSRGIGTTVYFLTRSRSAPIGVRRIISRKSPYALQALRALLAGPTESERKLGITTAIPARVRIRFFSIEACVPKSCLRPARRVNARVYLLGLPLRANGVERVRIITQLTRSLVGLSGIERIWIRNHGKPWGLYLMSGGVADRAHDYKELLGFTRICGSARWLLLRTSVTREGVSAERGFAPRSYSAGRASALGSGRGPHGGNPISPMKALVRAAG